MVGGSSPNLAKATVHLVSDESADVTGIELLVDGGNLTTLRNTVFAL